MKLTLDDVRHLAALSRLSLSDSELASVIPKMEAHLDFAQQLMEINTEGIPPTTHTQNLVNIFREDNVTNLPESSKALEAAPSIEGQRFRVPRILGITQELRNERFAASGRRTPDGEKTSGG